MYEKRYYRQWMQPEDMAAFRLVEYETDLFVAVSESSFSENLKAAVVKEIHRVRQILVDYEKAQPGFFESLVPLAARAEDPGLIAAMKAAASLAGVGPMAAVAGAVSHQVGHNILGGCPEYILENGGDLFIKTRRPRRVAVETGHSPFEGLHLLIEASEKPLGICTSSGIMGHSLSFGRADAATVISEDVYLADAAATALGNRVKRAEDIQAALNWVQTVPGVLGALVIADGQLGAWGAVVLD
ncbi:MAG: UPF0280 family protein [Eubacterium sp.]|nr:UPF0280 family protein [Eubacterium sp.]